MTSQNVSRLGLKTLKNLTATNFLTKSGKEYCEFAVRARIVELEQKQAEGVTARAARIEKSYAPPIEPSNDLPPAPPKDRASTVVTALMKVKKPLFAIGKKLGFTFAKSIEQLENGVVTTSYKFEVKF